MDEPMVRIQVQLPPHLVAAIDEQRGALIPRAAWIRRALEDHLNHLNHPRPTGPQIIPIDPDAEPVHWPPPATDEQIHEAIQNAVGRSDVDAALDDQNTRTPPPGQKRHLHRYTRDHTGGPHHYTGGQPIYLYRCTCGITKEDT